MSDLASHTTVYRLKKKKHCLGQLANSFRETACNSDRTDSMSTVQGLTAFYCQKKRIEVLELLNYSVRCCNQALSLLFYVVKGCRLTMHTQLTLTLRTSGFSGINGHKNVWNLLFSFCECCQGNTLTDNAQKIYTVSGVSKWLPNTDATKSASHQMWDTVTVSTFVPEYWQEKSVFVECFYVKLKLTLDLLEVKGHHFIILPSWVYTFISSGQQWDLSNLWPSKSNPLWG